MTRVFEKPALTIDQQIARLRDAGMAVADEDYARHWLTHVSYYRLSGYWHIYKDHSAAPATRFARGTDFVTVTELYSFDRRLRRMVARD
jgi:abortive infection bacteriophage resistance protein